MTARQLLFNHIPKTGGVTLRIILNRVYGEKNIFLIKSTDIGGSLRSFQGLPGEERARFAVVAGHGAELFRPYMEDPFRVTILREPVALFLSQYYYLKSTEDAGFYDEVIRLKSIEEYLDFAIENGQDNLLTRYLSGSVGFLADPGQHIPRMQEEGDELLKLAKNALHEYDAVMDLADFDAGIYYLAEKLGWKKIPLYRPANRNKKNPGPAGLTEGFSSMLRDALKYDISLYEEFKRETMATGLHLNRNTLNFKLFRFRQTGIRFVTKML
jgi:hypothetical protein